MNESKISARSINLNIDGVIFEMQSRGGISRIFTELLPMICDIDDSLIIHLYHGPLLKQSLPKHNQIVSHNVWDFEQLLQPGNIWLELRSRIRAWCMHKATSHHKESDIWCSTYYTNPQKWKGINLLFVYDMIYEKFPEFIPDNTSWLKKQKERCIKAAHKIITISNTTRDDISKYYEIDKEKISVLYLSQNTIFRSLHKVNQMGGSTKPYLLYVGKRAGYKNFNMLLTAYTFWPSKDEVDFVVVGPNWNRYEKMMINQFKLESNVKIHRDVSDEDLCHLYNNAVAFCYPSLYEGFGIPLLEAMVCGCPIIASSIPSTKEIARDIPIYFDIGHIDSLLNAFDIALQEGHESNRIIAGSKLATRYSWERTGKALLEILYQM